MLDEVRDAHRGEGVLVVSHGGAIMVTVPMLLAAPRASAYDLVLPGGGYVALEGDASGWRAADRPSETSTTGR